MNSTSLGPSPVTTPLVVSLRVNKTLIESVLTKPKCIRNVCILAHVDHGKTTLTDTLLASNGIISFKQAGKLRYLDSREDEQIRGITMEASAITLLYDSPVENSTGEQTSIRYAINLIDSPGHVDFSRQVVTATRLCDGCLVLVDAVEGVCTQTLAVLRQARRERLAPCLVINKIDRLVSELKLSTTDAAIWLQRLLEQVNAAKATIWSDNYGDDGNRTIDEINRSGKSQESGEAPFGTLKGDVVFASSTDGWAFTIEKFVILYASRLEMNPTLLRKALWGDFYFDAKNKRVVSKKAAEKEGLVKPMLAQFVLDPIWSVYEASLMNWNEAKILKISTTTGAKIPSREIRNCDGKGVLKSLMGQWLPLAETIFGVIVAQCPSPLEANKIRLDSMVQIGNRLPATSRAIIEKLANPEHTEDEPVVAFISKFFSVTIQITSRTPSYEDLQSPNVKSAVTEQLNQFSLDATSKREKLIGMARIFHGTLRRGQNIYILGPKHIPDEAPQGILFQANELYLLMGRDLEPVDSVNAGSVFGIGGLESLIEGQKNATLASSLDCPCLAPPRGETVPIVHVAIRPLQLEHLSDIISGLKLLCQADPCAETFLEEESGEYILAVAGELHLEQCLKDLKERYTPPGIDLIVSPPIVPYRETISREHNRNEEVWKVHLGFNDSCRDKDGLITLCSTDGKCKISAKAVLLPDDFLAYIINNRVILRNALAAKPGSPELTQMINSIAALMKSSPAPWSEMNASQIWTLGPRRDPTNLLICTIPGDQSDTFYNPIGYLRSFQSSILTAFQLVTDKGPLAHEPLLGVAFIIEDFQLTVFPYGDNTKFGDEDENSECDEQALVSNQFIPLCKTLFEASFLFWSPRLMLAVYRCLIQTTAEMLGRVYSIISKRHGKIISEEYQDGTGFFSITARLPVIESFGLADDLRSRTAGVAIPQLIFAGFDELPQDPFWVPTTEEEITEFGKTGIENSAMKYLMKIRERKGLYIERKIVQFAEKQRTLKK